MLTNYWIYGVFRLSDMMFPLELLLAESIFYSLLKRRKGFPPKFAAGFLLYGLFVLLAPPTLEWNYNFVGPENLLFVFYAIGYCTVLFILSFAVALIAYDELPRTVIFCAIAGYCVQHLSVQVADAILLFLPDSSKVVSYGVCFLLDAVLFGAFFFSLKWRLRIDEVRDMGNKNVIGFFLAALFVTVLLAMFSRLEAIGPVTKFVEAIYSAMSCLLILMLQLNVFRRLELMDRADTIERMWKQDRAHYRLSRAYVKDIEVKAHDLKHAIGSLRQKYSEDFVEEAERSLSAFSSLYDTGNEALDVVLSEKALLCSAEKIRITCMADGRALGFIKDSDLYFCLGNALDNAITAVRKLADQEKKLISVSLRREKDLLSLHIENYFDGVLVLKNGLPETSKEDKKHHGFGMQSIQAVVEKYGGHMTCSAVGDMFYLNLLFPLSKASDFDS